MISIPINLLTSLVSQCSYTRPKGVIHKYLIFPSNYLSHLCACVVLQTYTHRDKTITPTYIGSLWLIDMRLLQVVSIQSLGTLSYKDICYMECYSTKAGSIVIRSNKYTKYTKYEVIIDLESIKFLSKSYENHFRALFIDYMNYLYYSRSNSLFYNEYTSLNKEVHRLRIRLRDHINNIPSY